ncbi:uncharacterized protein METZ01_LOCUS21825 [marine metagenome]|uniref:Trk system potassium uptake protein TrkA n=1 Tax=marine metagenome TaxID=408172 RepID=A0A381PPL3_9ZZZZ
MKIVVIGAGEVGFQLSKVLSEEDFDITIIEISKERVQRASENLDVITVRGDGASPDILREADVEKADIVVAVTRVDEVNLIASQLSHELGANKIIARLRNTEYSEKGSLIRPERFGIDKVIHPEMAATAEINRLVRQTSATSIVDFEGGRLQLIGIRLDSGCPIIEQSLDAVQSRNGSLAFNAVGIIRGKDTIVPHGKTEFEINDICYFLVRKEQVENLMYMVGKPVRETRNVMILGGGKIGRAVAYDLQEEINVRLVDKNRDKAQMLASELNKTLVLNGDGTDIEFLRLENLEELDSYIALTENEQTNLLSALLAKHLGARQTMIHVSTPEYIPAMKMIGLDAVVSKNMCTVNEILEYIKSDEKLVVTNFEDIDVEAIEFSPEPGSKITQKPLGEISFPTASVIGAINHRGHVSIAHGDTQITEEDSVLVFCQPEVLSKVEKLFN